MDRTEVSVRHGQYGELISDRRRFIETRFDCWKRCAIPSLLVLARLPSTTTSDSILLIFRRFSTLPKTVARTSMRLEFYTSIFFFFFFFTPIFDDNVAFRLVWNFRSWRKGLYHSPGMVPFPYTSAKLLLMEEIQSGVLLPGLVKGRAMNEPLELFSLFNT